MGSRPTGIRAMFDGTPRVRAVQFVALAASLGLGVFGPAAVHAQDSSSPAVEESSGGSTDDALSIVEGMMEEWLEGPGRSFRDKPELNVVSGASLVDLEVDNPRWPKMRSLAFQDAFVQAMREYVESIRQITTTRTARDYFSEDIPESELVYQEGEPPDSFLERIVLKSAVLAEQTLDRKLAESGLSDDEIERLTTPVQKRTTLAKRISRETLTRAFDSAAGLVPVKTFEAIDDEGNSAIGVVAVYLQRMHRIANQISRGEVIRPDPSRAGESIPSRINSYEIEELPNEFGVRVMWDEQGYPAIVSFGQWGWSPANLSKRKRAQRRKFAQQQAETNARSNLTEFVNASAEFTREAAVGAYLEEAYELTPGGVPEETEVREMTDRLVRTARVKAEVALTGYTPIKSWSAPHPLLDEQEVVGAIAYWSPAREDAIRKTVGQAAKHAPPEQVSQQPKKKQATGSAQSRDPDLADF